MAFGGKHVKQTTLLAMAIVAALPAVAQSPERSQSLVTTSPGDEPDPQVTNLNHAIQKRLDENNARASAVQDQYAKERAAYEIAMRKNAEEVAAAATRKSVWEAEMAGRDKLLASGPKPRALATASAVSPEILVKANEGKRICHMESATGSLVKQQRVCTTRRESNERRLGAQEQLRAMTQSISGCGKAVCE